MLDDLPKLWFCRQTLVRKKFEDQDVGWVIAQRDTSDRRERSRTPPL